MINGNNSSTTVYRQTIEPWNNDKPEPVGTNMADIVRIRISAALNGRAVEMLQYEWISLLDGCMFTRYVVPNNGSGGDGDDNSGETLRPAVQTFYEEPVVEGDFTVEADVTFRRPTLAMTAQALVSTWCREMGHGLQDQPRLEILNPEAWFLSCVQLHKNITLNGFELGNFINYGLFISHYTLDMQDRHITNTNVVRKGEMDCLFEHDFRRMAIRFTLGEFNTQRDSYVWHLYKMILDYGSIHSAIVDYSEKDHVALYLNVKYPPKVVIDEPKQRTHLNQYQSSSIQSYGKRSHNFFRTANVLNWGRKLGRSSTIKIIYSLSSNNNNRERMLEEFWQILSRLKARAKIHVYFLAVRTNPAASELTDDWISDDIFDSFACYYLVNALCSRGYAVLDQIDAKFVTVVADASKINSKATEKALEQLLSAIDEHRYFSILIAFSKLYKRYATSSSDIAGTVLSSVEEEYLDVPRNCVRVRKVIVTPTREMLMPPEVMMANRVLRQFGEEYAVRVLFRDEDGQKLRGDHMQQGLFKMMVEKLLMEGKKFGQRHYRFLAWSNSQLRDHGCYMYCTTDRGMSVVDIRRWMGDFTASSSIPKYMSRMGQCFTQAQEAVKIPYSDSSTIVKIEHDITSVAKDPNTGEPYVFSDGIGRISMALAKKICEQLELDQPVPSAYQIRYAGCKGMLSIDIRLDKNPQGYQLILRDSMKKFSSDTSYILEIVKYSQPSEVCLNRPLIMILDQVSRKQGCGPRVSNEIHKLLEKQLFTMSDMLLSEEVSVDALANHTPLKIDYKKLRESGFNLTVEPFFRGLLLAVHKYTLKAQLFKAKIEIPFDQGRTMYGVLDETNVLQYGQVFIQFSENRNKPGENVKIYTGKVMVTKNPCVVPGDVRIFEAVYKDALKHLVDVIVFPRNGPRPHTDEMAGSDLDGDEYAVYWNQNLMFNKNEEAMQFPKAKADVIRGGVTDRNMVDFFILYVNQDSIGAVATAHLVMADSKGIYDPVCMSIAKKCSMAVDFPKTGVAADRLTEDERPSKYPDYFQRESRPMYISRRLLGQVFSARIVFTLIIGVVKSPVPKWLASAGARYRVAGAWDILMQEFYWRDEHEKFNSSVHFSLTRFT